MLEYRCGLFIEFNGNASHT